MSVDCCDDGEPVDNYQEGVKRARANLLCTACGLTIERGHLYHRTYYEYEDEKYEHDRCARCEAMFRFLRPCVDVLSGDETVALDLDCGHEWKDNFEGDPPLAVQALAFLTPAEAQVLIRPSRRAKDAVPFGPRETEEHRIARLLATIFGDRVPVPTEKFVAVEREDREEDW